MESQLSTIPRLRRVFRDTKANLDALTGLRDGALGYGTDTAILYRQNGAGAANWEAISALASYFLSGTAAGRPSAGACETDTIYLETDSYLIKKIVGGAWVTQSVASPWSLTEATLADFQANPGTGTATNAFRINDNDTGLESIASNIGDYAQVDFDKWVKIDQWRYFGDATMNEDGHSKIQYYGIDEAWHDWVTGIATRLATWTTMAVETEVICRMIRFTATAIDTGGALNRDGELEVYHS